MIAEALISGGLLAAAVVTLAGLATSRERRSRQRTEEEQQRDILVVENTGDFVGIADLHHRMIFVNRAGQMLVGLDGDEEARQTTLLDYFPGDERDEIENRYLPLLDTDGHFDAEAWCRHFKTGERIPMLWSASVIADPKTGST